MSYDSSKMCYSCGLLGFAGHHTWCEGRYVDKATPASYTSKPTISRKLLGRVINNGDTVVYHGTHKSVEVEKAFWKCNDHLLKQYCDGGGVFGYDYPTAVITLNYPRVKWLERDD